MIPYIFKFYNVFLKEKAQLIALLTKLQSPATIRTITGTTGALTAEDFGSHIRTTNAGATAITVPLDATVAFPIGSVTTLNANGAGAVTLTPEGGVTLNKSAAKTLVVTRYGEVKLRKVGTNEWDVSGDLVAA